MIIYMSEEIKLKLHKHFKKGSKMNNWLLYYNANNQSYYKIILLYNYDVKKEIDTKGGGGAIDSYNWIILIYKITNWLVY